MWRAWVHRHVCPYIESGSVWLHGLIWPDLPPMSICAHAHFREDVAFWRAYARLIDRLLSWWEPEHCRESYRRCFR